MAERRHTAVLLGSAAGAICLGVAFVAASYGHGTYSPAILLFPWSMALSGLVGVIATPLIILALVQYPVYGAVVGMPAGRARRRAVLLLAVHLLGVGVAFVITRANGRFVR